MIESKQETEQVILFAVSTSDENDTIDSLIELEELVETAGAVAVDKIIQNREAIHPGTYFGKGKLEELKERIWETDATGVVCDDELSPAQLRNMEEILETKVMDRTMIILDIFAARASSKEGKLQVELAQLKYRSARLVGLRNSLSRLGGGIGTRGPGEKKLEMDRRLISERMSHLKRELNEVKRHRETTRSLRSKSKVSVAAIVGYTNAGKSTLLNALTDAGVIAENKLFATLDPTTRNLKLPSGEEILVTDTVGFIKKLPHHLVEAFKSTLEEAKYADMILHVVDSSNPRMDSQMHTVYETLEDLGVGQKTVITLFNKSDVSGEDKVLRDLQSEYSLRISAKMKTGLEELKILMDEVISKSQCLIERFYLYGDQEKMQLIRKYGRIISEDYRDDGIAVKAYIPFSMEESV